MPVPNGASAGLSNAVAVAAGYAHSLALRGEGIVVSWGMPYYGITNVPVGLSNVVDVAAGANHSLAVIDEGSRPFLAPMVTQLKAPLKLPIFIQVQAVGEKPMHYLWQKDGAPLTGATNTLLKLAAVNTNESGDYRCIVANAQGLTTGSVVHMTVLEDFDGDGMPDAWEAQFFGHMTNADSSSDTDGDGSPDASEYVSGTDDQSGLSFFDG